MPKINVYLPDDLAEAVRESGVPVSLICQRALEQTVRRVTAVRATALGNLDAADPLGRLSHFTGRARTVIGLAVEQARAQGAQIVGTEHLLGGLLAEGHNMALHVLRAEEIEPGQVAHDLLGRPTAEPGAAGAGTTRQFSTHAANALELTVTEAIAFGHNYIGSEHLLLGLVIEPDGTAGHILRALGAEPRATRRAVAAALAGYVHMRAQTAGGDQLGDATPMDAAAAGQETEVHIHAADLQPLIRRIERLEEQAGLVPPLADPGGERTPDAP